MLSPDQDKKNENLGPIRFPGPLQVKPYNLYLFRSWNNIGKIEQILSRGVQNDQKYFPEKDVYTRCQEDIEGHLISKDQTIQFNSIQPLKEIKLFPLWIHGRGPFQDFEKDFEIFQLCPILGEFW